MTDTTSITPRLGPTSATILGLILVGAITLVSQHVSLGDRATVIPEPVANARYRDEMWLKGMIFGIAAGGFWLASVIGNRYLRWFARGGWVILLALAQIQLSGGWLRQLANLGGLAGGQCLLFALMRVPAWVTHNRSPLTSRDRPSRAQFGIGDLVVATTCIAFLLAIAARYSPPIEPLQYWMVLLVSFWAVAPLITGCVAGAILSRDLAKAATSLSAAIVLILLCVLMLSGAEIVVSRVQLQANKLDLARQITLLYGRLIGGYVLVFACFALAGRIQQMREACPPGPTTA